MCKFMQLNSFIHLYYSCMTIKESMINATKSKRKCKPKPVNRHQPKRRSRHTTTKIKVNISIQFKGCNRQQQNNIKGIKIKNKSRFYLKLYCDKRWKQRNQS